jgi:uroporphyrinogen-III synthase
MTPPILLLKTKSSPQDGYDEFFTSNNYNPTFVPVLEHRFHQENLTKVATLFNTGAFPQKYGGLIFTSQRAVEGFADLLSRTNGTLHIPKPKTKNVKTDKCSHHPLRSTSSIHSRSGNCSNPHDITR